MTSSSVNTIPVAGACRTGRANYRGGASPEGLPIGVQLVAPHRDEATLLGAATALEQAGDLAVV